MECKAAEVEGLLRRPQASWRALLLFGSNPGLIRENACKVAQAFAPAQSHPFARMDLPCDVTPGALGDALNSIPLGGGRRLVCLRAGEGAAAAITATLEQIPPQTLLLIEAASLPPAHRLRAAFRALPATHLSCPCYEDKGPQHNRLAKEQLSAEGLRLAHDADLTAVLGGDRASNRNEIEKLVLYAQSKDVKEITNSDIRAVVCAATDFVLEDFAYAVATGADQRAVALLARARQQGVPELVAWHALGRLFLRLYCARVDITHGLSVQEAAKRLRPPIFWTRMTAFTAALRLWTEQELRAALAQILVVEQRCKQGLWPTEPVTAMATLQLAREKSTARRQG